MAVRPKFALPIAVAMGCLLLSATAAPHSAVFHQPRPGSALLAEGPVDGGGPLDLTMPGDLFAPTAPGTPTAPALPSAPPGDVVTGGEGTVNAVPAVSVSGSAAGIPARVLAAYQAAAATIAGDVPGCHLSWQVLAGIGKVESGHARGGALDANGRTLSPILGPVLDGGPGIAAISDTDGGRWDGDTLWDRAVGPMQFIPSSWRSHAADGNRDGVSDPSNMFDAALASAGYLCASGRDLSALSNLRQAVFGYNHSWAYVATVLAWAHVYTTGDVVATASTGGGRVSTGGAPGGGRDGAPSTPARSRPGTTSPRPAGSTPAGSAPAGSTPTTPTPTTTTAASGGTPEANPPPTQSSPPGTTPAGSPPPTEPGTPTPTDPGTPTPADPGTPTPTPTPTPTCPTAPPTDPGATPTPTDPPVVPPTPSAPPGDATDPAAPPDPTPTPVDPCATPTPTPTPTPTVTSPATAPNGTDSSVPELTPTR